MRYALATWNAWLFSLPICLLACDESVRPGPNAGGSNAGGSNTGAGSEGGSNEGGASGDDGGGGASGGGRNEGAANEGGANEGGMNEGGAGAGAADCTEAVAVIEAKYAECDFRGEYGRNPRRCTAEEGVLLLCISDCIVAAPCGIFDGTDPEAAADYVACVRACD